MLMDVTEPTTFSRWTQDIATHCWELISKESRDSIPPRSFLKLTILKNSYWALHLGGLTLSPGPSCFPQSVTCSEDSRLLRIQENSNHWKESSKMSSDRLQRYLFLNAHYFKAKKRNCPTGRSPEL